MEHTSHISKISDFRCITNGRNICVDTIFYITFNMLHVL